MAKNHIGTSSKLIPPGEWSTAPRAPSLDAMLLNRSAFLVRWPVAILAVLLGIMVFFGLLIKIQEKMFIEGVSFPLKRPANLKNTTKLTGRPIDPVNDLIKIKTTADRFQRLKIGQTVLISLKGKSVEDGASGIIVSMETASGGVDSWITVRLKTAAEKTFELPDSGTVVNALVFTRKISLINFLVKHPQ